MPACILFQYKFRHPINFVLVIQNYEFSAVLFSHFFMIYVRQSLDNSEGGCSPRHRLRPSDFVSALMDV